MENKNKFLAYKIIIIFLSLLAFSKLSYSQQNSFKKITRSNFPGYTILSLTTTTRKCQRLCSQNKKV